MPRTIATPDLVGKSAASDGIAVAKSPTAIKSRRCDRDSIKVAARGQWPAIIENVAGISDDFLSPNHGPCPKCGGHDRWRVFDDFAETGGAICNQCGKFGDGFSLVGWALDLPMPQSFSDVLVLVSDHLGANCETTEPPNKIDSLPKKPPRPLDSQIKPDTQFYPKVFELWSRSKGRGITPDGANECHAITGRHIRLNRDVIAVPVLDESLDPRAPTGYWYALPTNELIPGKDAKGALTSGCTGVGVMVTRAFVDAINNGKDLSNETVWKVEGPPDLIALASSHSRVFAFTNKAGATEKPFPEIIDRIAKCNPGRVAVVGDCDEPGKKGAAKWAHAFAGKGADARLVQLPYEITPTRGKDVRDYLVEGHAYDDLVQLVEATESIKADRKIELDDLEDGEDPHDPARLARVNVGHYRSRGGSLRYWHGQWWRYRRGVWRFTAEDEIRAKVRIGVAEELVRIHDATESREDGKKPKRKPLTRSLVSDVIDAMKSQCFLSSAVEMPCWLPDRSQRQLLSTSNGMIDIDAVIAGADVANAFLDHSPEWFCGVQVDYAFDADAKCPRWLEYLASAIPDDASQKLAQEWAGYVLTARNPLQKFLACEGEGGTGKSVYAAGLTAMLGEHSVSNADLSQFGTQFGLGKTIGRALNIDSDVERFAKFSEGTFKKFVVGERMDFQLKGGDPFSQCPTAKVVLLWNERPRIKDTSNGFWRRMLLLPFNVAVPNGQRVYGMDQPSWWRDQGELPGLLNWSIEGLRRLSAQQRFTEPAAMHSLIRGYRNEMDPVQAFLEAMVIDVSSNSDIAKSSFLGTQSAVAAFRGWCVDFASEKEAEAMNARRMGKAIAKRFPNATAHTQTTHDQTRLRGYLGLQMRLHPEDEPARHGAKSPQQPLDGF